MGTAVTTAVTAPVAVATSTAAYFTEKEVIKLKKQIQKIIKEHKKAVDEVKEFQTLSKSYSLSQIQKELSKVSQRVSLSLGLIADDQSTKMKLLMNLNLVKDKAQDYDTTWAQIFNAIRIPSTMLMVTFAAIELAGGDLFDGILDSMMVVMDMVQNIMTIIHDQKQIKQLQSKKDELNKYFKAGGEFDKTMESCQKLIIQLVNNQYILTVVITSIFDEIKAIIQIISIDQDNTSKYNKLINLINSQPFDVGFQNQLKSLKKGLQKIQSKKGVSLESKIIRMMDQLKSIDQKYRITNKNKSISNIVKNLNSDSSVWTQVDAQFDQIKYMNQIRQEYKGYFEIREKSNEDMRKLQDPIYLQQIKQQFEKKNYPTQTINLRVAELISFFTSSYYSSKEADPTKVFQYNLSELSKKTREMYFIDTALDERGLFSFKIPQPKDKSEHEEWTNYRQQLLDQFIRKYKKEYKMSSQKLRDSCWIEFFYKQIISEKDTVNGKPTNQLVLYAGILVKVRVGQGFPQPKQFSIRLDELDEIIKKSMNHKVMHLMMPEEPNQEFLMESSDLESLIRVGEAHANNFGLSRLKSISITETEKGQYELEITASYSEQKPELRFQILSSYYAKSNECISNQETVISVDQLGCEGKIYWIAK